MTADSWHSEKSYLKSGWYKRDSYAGMLTNFRRLSTPKPLPTMNSLTYAEITPRAYSAEASRGQLQAETQELWRKGARVYPVPLQIQAPETRVLEHYKNARARSEHKEFKRTENLRLKKERDNTMRKIESEKKARRQQRKARGEDEDVASDDSSDVDSPRSLNNAALPAYISDSDEPLSEDELPDAFFESFRDESRLVKALDHLPQLDRLHLAGHHWLSEAFICDIGLKYTSLRSLNLRGCAVTDEAVARIAQNCRLLHSLDLSFCKSLNALDLTGLVGLQELRLSRLSNVVTSEFVASLRPMRKLTTIDFSFSTMLGDMGLQELAEGCRALTWVDLSSCPCLTGAGVLAIARANPNIRHLFLMLNDQHSMSDEDISHVARHLKRLQALDVSACLQLGRLTISAISRHCQFVEKLSLASLVQITNDEVRLLLSKCPSLSHIDLSGCALLTSEALFELGNTKSLKRIVLSMTPNIADEFLEGVRKRCPNLQVDRHSRVQEHPEDLSLSMRCPPKPIKKGKKKRKGAAKAKAKK
eukprot:gnl/MRDRNA2_/MRDRNA2_108613_c0_seq1.p1 gnl/MRDRNA2_/MRDRNA2_108613_c0~~gnl/MRDRNA2_/MRDRNA2_108613_c0_seq1.p1  ORF type:complete len:532 (-),score=101.86 gnl/MRDRNA2_/MRDRNA2_108613_c0_seq1:13-1608(-)